MLGVPLALFSLTAIPAFCALLLLALPVKTTDPPGVLGIRAPPERMR